METGQPTGRSDPCSPVPAGRPEAGGVYTTPGDAIPSMRLNLMPWDPTRFTRSPGTPSRSLRGRCWGRMRITVVTVTNDWPPFADEAIASVERDEAFELEHIVVGDGAPELAEALSKR